MKHPGCLERCPECPRKGPVVPGCGPTDADIMFIGEAPGKEENERRIPFVGRSGQEFDNNYLPVAGLDRRDVFVTNAVACFIASSGKAPSDKLVDSCSAFHLKRDLQRINPRVVVPMGAVSGSLFGRRDLETYNGIPFTGKLFGRDYKVVQMYHPALGMHKTGSMLVLRQGFESLRRVLDGSYQRAKDPAKGNVHYRELKTAADIRKHFDPNRSIAIDTETDGGLFDPAYCLTYSQDQYSGFMIRRNSPEALLEFSIVLSEFRRKIYIHHSLFDIRVLNELYVNPPFHLIDDTMHRAYHLGNVPKGLKPLSWRLAGIKMDDFMDVCTPYWEPKAFKYLIDVLDTEWGKPAKVWVEEKGVRKEKQPQGINMKVKRLVNDYANKGDSDLLDRWDDWGDERLPVIQKLGKMPVRSIVNVPFEKQLQYACTDSRSTWILGEMILPELIDEIYQQRMNPRDIYRGYQRRIA